MYAPPPSPPQPSFPFDRCQLTLSKLPKLEDADLKIIDSLHKKPGMHRSLLNYHQADGTVFGWTYEQLGWELGLGGKVKA